MSAITDTSNTTIRLHSVPWNDYVNVPCFSTQNQLDNYFDTNYTNIYYNMRIVRYNTSYSVQLDFNSFVANGINYMTFDNGNGREYAFIKNPRFISLNTTEFDIEIDVWTTYLFKHSVSGLVHRAHVPRWSDGIATPIYYKGDWDDVGELLVGRQADYSNAVVWAAIYCSEWPQGFTPEFATNHNNFPRYLGGTVNNLCVYLVPFVFRIDSSNPSRGSLLTGVLLKVGSDSARLSGFLPQSDLMKSENIYTIQLLPFTPFSQNYDSSTNTVTVSTGLSGEYVNVSPSGQTPIFYYAVKESIGNNAGGTFYKYYNDKPTSSPTYNTPANINYESRLWSAPYYQLLINNYSNSLLIDPADIDGSFIRFNIALALGGGDYGTSFRVTNWSNDSYGVKKQINDTEPLVISWKTDKFYNYMIQNQSQMITKQAFLAVDGKLSAIQSSMAHAGASPATRVQAGVLNAVERQVDLLRMPATLLATSADAEYWPKSVAGASGSSGLAVSAARMRITCQSLVANDYIRNTKGGLFIQYGYEINQSSTNFNIRSRYWFNYVQYTDCVCTASKWLIPEHKRILEEIYRNGVRAWHYRSGFRQFGKYNLDNTEV